MQDQAFRYSPNAYGLPVLEKRLHIPRNDPMEQSDYIIFSSHQCTVMVPDGKGQNPVFNSVLTLTLTNYPQFLITQFLKYSFFFLTNDKGDLGGRGGMSVCQFELPKPVSADQLLPGGVPRRLARAPFSPQPVGNLWL